MQKKEEYIPFRRFDFRQDVQQFVEILEKNEIDYKLEECPKDANLYFFNRPQEKEFLLKLRHEDFKKADEFVVKHTEVTDVELDTNHYLYSFTDEELIEILDNPYEWNEIDRSFAPKLLENRGFDLSKLDIEGRKEKYVEELLKGKGHKEAPKWMIIVGYITAFFGGFLGIAIGWGLVKMKTTLPNGKQVYTYNEKSQKHGVNIFILSVVMFVICIIYQIVVHLIWIH